MTTLAFPQTGLDRLAKRIVAGEVVFFVGSGFSVDSEGNTTSHLIGRLLARFDAMTLLLMDETPAMLAAFANELRRGLKGTFSLSDFGTPLTTKGNVATLAREYYAINDWMTSAFSLLLEEIKRNDALDHEQFIRRLCSRERVLLAGLTGKRSPRLSQISLDDLKFILTLPPAEAGKALFLETVGFADPQCMGGKAFDLEVDGAEQSYIGLLRPRHRVLAWLVREGLASTLLTTNFDLLLEGAYRLAGMTPELPDGSRLSPAALPKRLQEAPPASFDAFRRITSATEFFGHGDDHRSASLLKIHGCAESYRWARKQNDWLEAYLPSIVFTFREIQNWREDSWSRDMVSTLLRTRTMAFCGYSGADPVLHDTIRTVYEEMGRRRARLGPVAAADAKREEAPAFFLGGSGKTEFHGMEILRAASRAVGDAPELTDHPNYLRFHFTPESGEGRFPSLDEEMRWLFLLVFRRRQAQALKANLRRLSAVTLGHRCAEREQEEVLGEFEKLCEAEKQTARTWKGSPGDRAQFERMVGWVEHFQMRLLREFSMAEAVLRAERPGRGLECLRRANWYYPALDHSDWAAWGAIVELALRRRIAAWQGVENWEKDQRWLWIPAGNQPTVCYSRGPALPAFSHLTIRLRSEDLLPEPAPRGALRKQVTWKLDHDKIPWPREARDETPGAETLWSWAHQPSTRFSNDEFDKFLL